MAKNQPTAISRQQVKSAMDKYDKLYPSNDYPGTKKPWYQQKRYHWAIENSSGKFYPLKYILALIISKDTGTFHTVEARSELKKLGFNIVELTQSIRNQI